MTATQPGARIGYIPAIDGLRAVAVGSVILYHLWPGLLPGGFTGVDIFFVISGFVVTGSMAGKRFESLKELLLAFYARRLMRIMPALVAMLLAAILATQLFVPDAWLSNSVAVTGKLAFAGLSNIALAFDSDSYFGPQAGYNPFTHSWSLGVEEQFYLLFPFLLHRRQTDERGVIRLVAILSLASFALCGVLAYVDPKLAFYLIVTRFWELGTGMLLRLTLERWKPWLAAHGGGPLVLAGLALVAGGLAIPRIGTTPFPFALLPVIGTAVLIAAVCAFPKAAVTRLLETRAMVGVGRLSYSLYLWHWPVFVLFRWTTGLEALPLQLTALALACGLATLSYFLVEQPLRTNKHISAAPRGRVVAFALGGVGVSALAGVALFMAHDQVTLSVTRDHAAWYADERHPLDPRLANCTVREEVFSFGGGKESVWIPEGCNTPPAGFTLYTVGDSHNLAYAPNYRQLAAELGVPVHAWFKAGCPVMKLTESHASRPRCKGWYDALVAEIGARAKRGDVVFMPSLRLTRFTNQFEGDRDILNAKPDRVAPESLAEAQATLNGWTQHGLGLVIEAPKPMFRSPPFRCSDWFNRDNPICHGLSVPRAELLSRQKPVSDAIQTLAARLPGLFVWDPFPALCPGEVCQAQAGGKPLFFDGDHLSGAGNDLLYPGLRGAVMAASDWSLHR
ncbi:acyltransferase [Sphingomonas sp. LB-2]|uniref:acyltransferase family protein n=1 Tax=Sphingomonas caeni TaxID=2984949 RepID=UPI0022325C86|nr:acyltransferase family protein [Sphingomonas caeni]MCW3847493.1 acyltransferase [Sphingomonas caeni]